jgi:hypothetical protein
MIKLCPRGPIYLRRKRNDLQNGKTNQIYPATVHMAPNMQPTIVITTATTCGAPTEILQAPLAKAGKVVANCCVGFGDPLIVTVGALAAGDGGLEEGEAFAARTEKRCEVACIVPCVELRNIRK